MSIIVTFAITMGIPTAVTGLLFWWLKRNIDKRDARSEQHEQNIERLMSIILKRSQANNVLAEATARAVQRIPDAHCNGDMTEALEQAAAIRDEEEKFLFNQGIKHIFGE